MWDYRAKCLNVHDGDTITLLIDQGLYSRQEEQIRLIGVSAPELNQPGGVETREFVKSWLVIYDFGKTWPLYVLTHKTNKSEPEEKRSFTRYLATVYDIAKTSCLNEEIYKFLTEHPEWGPGVV